MHNIECGEVGKLLCCQRVGMSGVGSCVWMPRRSHAACPFGGGMHARIMFTKPWYVHFEALSHFYVGGGQREACYCESLDCQSSGCKGAWGEAERPFLSEITKTRNT